MEDEVTSWIRKVEKERNSFDLSKDEDLAIGIMNVVSLEEHFYFSYMKTNNKRYLDFLQSIRELRKNLMRRIVKNPEGEEWCISKHLLASSMRLYEVGTKDLGTGDIKSANFLFDAAFDLYSMFFSINYKIGVENIKNDEIINIETQTSNKFSKKISEIIKKIVDCCRE